MRGSFLPVSIMVICALLIHRNLRRKRFRRRQLVTIEQNNDEYVERKRDQQIVRMLLFQALVFVIPQTPWMLFNISGIPLRLFFLFFLFSFINPLFGLFFEKNPLFPLFLQKLLHNHGETFYN